MISELRLHWGCYHPSSARATSQPPPVAPNATEALQAKMLPAEARRVAVKPDRLAAQEKLIAIEKPEAFIKLVCEVAHARSFGRRWNARLSDAFNKSAELTPNAQCRWDRSHRQHSRAL
jgi:hypothetical protein